MRIPSQLSARGIDRVVAWSIPLTTRFRGITERDGLLLHGPAGWAEFSPFWDYDAEQSLPWLQAAIADACQERPSPWRTDIPRSEEHTSELQSRGHLVCRLLLDKKKRRS